MSTPPLAGVPASILARTEAPPAPMMAEQVFQRLLRHRIVVLGQQVDDDLANRVCAELILLAAEDGQRDISLYINSPGGSVSAGLAIYDVMQFVPNDILRSKAMTLLSERAAIKDESGRTVDLAALRQAAQEGAGEGEPDDAGE